MLDQVGVVDGDAADPAVIYKALEGSDRAYYLIHSLPMANDFEQSEVDLARLFATTAKAVGLRKVKSTSVETRWTNTSVPGTPSEPLPTDPDWAGGSLYRDVRKRISSDSPAEIWSRIESIGGENAYSTARWGLGTSRPNRPNFWRCVSSPWSVFLMHGLVFPSMVKNIAGVTSEKV